MPTLPRMRDRIRCLVVGVIVLGAAALGNAQQPGSQPPEKPLTAEQKERLKESARLGAEAQKLRQAGKLLEAIAGWEKKLAIEREVLGPAHSQVAASLLTLALMHEANQDYAAARKVLQERIDLRTNLRGIDHWQTADARRSLADLEQRSKMDPEQRKSLAEANRLTQQAAALAQQGKSRDALSLAQKASDVYQQVLGDKHLTFAQSLNLVARQYQTQRDFARAEPLYQRALEITKQALGEKHPSYATGLNNLGVMYGAQGARTKAEPLYRQALEILKETVGERNTNYITSLSNLGLMYRAQGEYSKAEPPLQQALEIAREVLGEKHPTYATSLNNLAMLHHAQGDHTKAEPLYRQALGIRKQALGDKHPDYATSLNNLALLHRDQKDYARAEPLLREALELRKQVRGEKHPEYAQALSNLALLHQAQGDHGKAEPLYRQALGITRQAQGEKHPDYATRLNNLAELHRTQGDFGRAEPLHRQALELRKQVRGEKHPDCSQSLNNLALLYHSQGDYAKAEPLYRQALEIRKQARGERHPDYATSLNNLALLHRDQKDHDRAEPLLREALELRKQVRGEKHPEYAQALNNLALLYQAQGDYGTAEPLYRQALDITRQALGEKHPDYATRLNNLALLYQARGDYGEAEPLHRQALEVRKQALGEIHPSYAQGLDDLASLYRARGDHAQAEPLVRQALQITRGYLDGTAAIQSERQQLILIADLRQYLDHYLTVSLKVEGANATAYGQALAWKGAAFQRQRRLTLAQEATDVEVRHWLDNLQTTLTRLTTLAFAQPENASQQQAWQAEIGKLTTDRDDLERKLAERSPAFKRLQEEQRLTPAQLQSVLPAGVILLDLLEYRHYLPPAGERKERATERRLAAFVVRHDREPVRVELGPVQPIAQAIEQWREASVGKDANPGKAAEAAQQLRGLLWEPLLPHLEGARAVLISPDGVVGRFAFAALPGSNPGAYLIEDIAIGTVPVPQMLPGLLASRQEAGRSGSTDSLLVVGAVDFGAAPTPALPLAESPSRAAVVDRVHVGFPLLQGTALELAAVRSAFRKGHPEGRVTELRGAEATEDAIRKQSRQQHYLHLATHGYFAPESVVSALSRPAPDIDRTIRHRDDRHALVGHHPGLLSGLALAGAGRGARMTSDGRQGDDGILTALEVAHLDLRSAELMVLSACETGRGWTAGGEGLLGLQQAFQAAGARALVAGLWKVEDAAASVLMEEFYRNIWEKKQPKLEALRQAQLTVLNDPERVRRRGQELGDEMEKRGLRLAHSALLANAERIERSPAAWWAAFVLSGDPGDLSATGPATANPPAVPEPDKAGEPADAPPRSTWLPIAAGVLSGLVLLAVVIVFIRRFRRGAAAGPPRP